MAPTVKNLPMMQETCVQSLDWEDSLEKGMATPSSILLYVFKNQVVLTIGCDGWMASPIQWP